MKPLFFCCLLLLSLVCSHCSSPEPEEQPAAVTTQEPTAAVNQASYTTLGAQSFSQLLQQSDGLQLIDVRTAEEFSQGYLPGARNLDFKAADFSRQLASLEKGKPVLVYCAVGGRSAKAAQQLQEMGFRQVYNLEGGIAAWQSSGKQVVVE